MTNSQLKFSMSEVTFSWTKLVNSSGRRSKQRRAPIPSLKRVTNIQWTTHSSKTTLWTIFQTSLNSLPSTTTKRQIWFSLDPIISTKWWWPSFSEELLCVIRQMLSRIIQQKLYWDTFAFFMTRLPVLSLLNNRTSSWPRGARRWWLCFCKEIRKDMKNWEWLQPRQ